MNQTPGRPNRTAACHGMSLFSLPTDLAPFAPWLLLEGFQGSAVLQSVDVQRIRLHGLVLCSHVGQALSSLEAACRNLSSGLLSCSLRTP